MKNLFFILFLLPFTLAAQSRFTPEYEKLCENEDGILGILHFRKCYPLNPRRDTILADGSISKIYFLSSHCYRGSRPSWRYMRMPDGVDMLLPCFAQFAYPSGLKPGLYNLVEDYVKVVGINDQETVIAKMDRPWSIEKFYDRPWTMSDIGTPIVETTVSYAPWKEPAPEWNARNTSTPSQPAAETTVSQTPAPCTIQVSGKSFPLKGKVQVVTSFPDIKVQVVTSFPDLRVQVVNSFPDDCGQWQFVNSFPDIKVQFVESFPDLKIQYVNSFPGTTR